MVSAPDQTPHALMNLTISHRTAAGVEKKEQYPISAWRGIAQRMVEIVKPGAHVSIKGYLTQKQTNEGTFMEVTAEEFQSTMPTSPVRPIRRMAVVSANKTEEVPSAQTQPSEAITQATIIADAQEE